MQSAYSDVLRRGTHKIFYQNPKMYNLRPKYQLNFRLCWMRLHEAHNIRIRADTLGHMFVVQLIRRQTRTEISWTTTKICPKASALVVMNRTAIWFHSSIKVGVSFGADNDLHSLRSLPFSESRVSCFCAASTLCMIVPSDHAWREYPSSRITVATNSKESLERWLCYERERDR